MSVGAGFYESPWGKHARIQLLTVSELLKDERIDMPQVTGANRTFKKAPRQKPKAGEQTSLLTD